MRITFILPYAGMSGGVRVVAIYARLLEERGHDVTIVSTRYRLPGWRERLYHGARHAIKRLTGWKAPSHLNGIDITHHVINHDPPVVDNDVPDGDVVIATWWETAEWVEALSASKGAKVYFIQGYEAHEGQPVDRVRATWHLPMRKITVSRWLQRVGREELGVDDVAVVPNGVDLEQFRAEPRGRSDAPTFGLLYSPHPVKGCEICMEAFERFRSTHPDAQMISFGIEEPSVVEPILPRRTRYFCQPAQERLRAIYGACDAWLVGSSREGFGLPILEAMGCRTPVISTPAGAAPELLADGGGILLCGEDPGSEMAEAMARIASLSDDDWRAMSEQARKTAEQHGWDIAVERFESILREAAGKRAAFAPALNRVLA